MTPDEIRAAKFECNDGAWETAKWVQEIAAQLAEANIVTAEARAIAKKRSDVLEEMIAELKPLIPKIREMLENSFNPPPLPEGYPTAIAVVPSAPLAAASTPVAAPSAPEPVIASAPEPVIASAPEPVIASAPEPDVELVNFLQAQGHSAERAIQILTNHADAVRADFEQAKGANDGKEKEAAPAQEERAVPQT